MTKTDVQKWLDRYGEAWVNGNPDQAVALFTNTATYRETPFDQPMNGHREIRSYWQEGASDSQEDVSFSSQVWAINADFAVAG